MDIRDLSAWNHSSFTYHDPIIWGITSSGSSTIVQLLYGLGLNQAVSVTIVQAATDYLDQGYRSLSFHSLC